MRRQAQAAPVTSRGCKETPSTLEGCLPSWGRPGDKALGAEVPQGSVREAGLEDSPLPRQMLLKRRPPSSCLSSMPSKGWWEGARKRDHGLYGQVDPDPGAHAQCPCRPDCSWGFLPLMDELLQGCALRHQLGEATSQHHKGQDGQQVIGTTVGQRHSWPVGSRGQYSRSIPKTLQPPFWPLEWSLACQQLALHPSCLPAWGVGGGLWSAALAATPGGKAVPDWEPCAAEPTPGQGDALQGTCGDSLSPTGLPTPVALDNRGEGLCPRQPAEPVTGTRHLRSPTRGI